MRQIGLDGYPIPGNEGLSVEANERRLPSDLQRSAIPLTIVCGAPGSGKSTYVAARATSSDIVIDLDRIMRSLSGMPEHHTDAKWVRQSLEERNRILHSLATDTKHRMAWFIVASPDAGDRARWHQMLGGQIVVMDATLDECIHRIKADPMRRGHINRMIKAATSWFEVNASDTGAGGDRLSKKPTLQETSPGAFP